MYGSAISKWNALEMGPKRDVLGELGKALEEKGITNGASSHRVEHWFFMGHGKDFDSDIKDPLSIGDLYWPAMPEQNHHDLFSSPAPSDEFLEDWLVRCCEIVDKYRPKLFYFDWWIQHSAVKPYLRKFAAYYYNRAEEWGKEVTICYKHDAFPFGAATVDIERGKFAGSQPFRWQTDTAIARNSWCWTENNVFKTAKSLVCDIVDIVSKNGVMLLNVGPKPDGTISDEDAAVLLGIGKWLKLNGEAIYGTGVWRKAGEGPTQTREGQFTDGEDMAFTARDIRFTAKGDAIYATVLEWPQDGKITITSLAKHDDSNLPVFHGIIKDIIIIGQDDRPKWQRDNLGLHVRGRPQKSDMPVVVKIIVD
jgi:alpha-L-fucosidase